MQGAHKALYSHGVTLVELLFFLVVMGIAMAAVVNVFSQSILTSNDPLIRIRALELGQAQLDAILSRNYDEASPSGGIPACNSNGTSLCVGITADADYDDVGDFNGFIDTSHAGYSVSVTVTEAGDDFGLAIEDARLITVIVAMPTTHQNPINPTLTLSAYRANF
ncbi:MAG: MSHA pilin protein MshD [Flavobacteriales bacterium]|jgi:MSHA pilin protein MshD